MGLFNRRKRRDGAAPDALTRAAVARIRAEAGIERVEAVSRDEVTVWLLGHDGARRVDLQDVRPAWQAASGFTRIEVLDTFMEQIGPGLPLADTDAPQGSNPAAPDVAGAPGSTDDPDRRRADATSTATTDDHQTTGLLGRSGGPGSARDVAPGGRRQPPADAEIPGGPAHAVDTGASPVHPGPMPPTELGADATVAASVPESSTARVEPAPSTGAPTSADADAAPAMEVHVGRMPPAGTTTWPVADNLSAWLVERATGRAATAAQLGDDAAAAATLGACLAELAGTDPAIQRIGNLRAWMVTAPAHRAAWLCAPEALLDAVRLPDALLVAPVADELVVIDPDHPHSVETVLANTASIVDEVVVPLHPAPLLATAEGMRAWHPHEAGEHAELVRRLRVADPLTD